MKALSLWQPWASLWLSPRKIHETRHWSLQVPRDGFWLAVHAAKKPMRDEGTELDAICYSEFGRDWLQALPRGALIGRVHVTQCIPTSRTLIEMGTLPGPGSEDFECGDFSSGRYAWRRDEFRKLRQPIPYRGMQGIFTVPDWSEEIELAA